MPPETLNYKSHFISAPDGLQLHLREYALPGCAGLPVVCLAGLSRNSADFAPLAQELAQANGSRPRRVIAIDYRGRGLSAYDRKWQNYNVGVESADILAILAAVGVEEAIFVGTSRGGINIMALAPQRPALIRAAVLNDIGPVIEARGLSRIRGYIGKMPRPNSWPDALDLMKRLNDAQFSGLSEAEWDLFARTTFAEKDGRLVGRYDPALMNTLAGLDLEAPLPTMWPQFAALAHVPMLVLRGENSDLLSRQTVAEMKQRHIGLQEYTVPGQGHAPLIGDALTIGRITDFVHVVDPV